MPEYPKITSKEIPYKNAPSGKVVIGKYVLLLKIMKQDLVLKELLLRIKKQINWNVQFVENGLKICQHI